jgi:uncharacterized membrane protein YfcA
MGAMNRRLRLGAALFGIAAMLFAPLAMALHACPAPGDMVPAAQAVAADEVAGTSMDMTACERHCTQAKASFDLAKPAAPAAAPFAAPLRVAALAPLHGARPALHCALAFAAGPAPPPLRSTVLRI